MKLAFELGAKDELKSLGTAELALAGLLKILLALMENVRRFFTCLSSSSSCAAGCSTTLEKDC